MEMIGANEPIKKGEPPGFEVEPMSGNAKMMLKILIGLRVHRGITIYA